MSIKQVIGAILNMLFRLAISCLVVVAVYRLAMYSYHFGYMVFNDAAKEVSPGRDITISVEMDDSVMDIGQTLASRGIVEDAKIFYVQELLSEYHGMIRPGIYILNTAMKPSEILAAMANKDENLNQEGEASDSSVSQTGAQSQNGAFAEEGQTPLTDENQSTAGEENPQQEDGQTDEAQDHSPTSAGAGI